MTNERPTARPTRRPTLSSQPAHWIAGARASHHRQCVGSPISCTLPLSEYEMIGVSTKLAIIAALFRLLTTNSVIMSRR